MQPTTTIYNDTAELQPFKNAIMLLFIQQRALSSSLTLGFSKLSAYYIVLKALYLWCMVT